MKPLFTNFARATLAAQLNAGATSATLESGKGVKFPAPGAGQNAILVIEEAAPADPFNPVREIITYTTRSTDTLSGLSRGQEGTSDLTWPVGSVVELRWTAAQATEVSKTVDEQVHAATTKATPEDADEFGFWDSVGLVLKKLTYANIKALFMAYVAPGASGNVLTSNGSAWTSAAPSSGVPAGSVIHVAKNTAPTGFLKANGALVSRTTYADLFSAIGTTFGAGDGSTTFALPDLRGEFIRGWDDGRGVDSGRGIGTAQTSQNLSHSHGGAVVSGGAHTHTVQGYENTGSVPTNLIGGFTAGLTPTGAGTAASAGAHQHTINADGGTEARPRNIALLTCIKY